MTSRKTVPAAARKPAAKRPAVAKSAAVAKPAAEKPAVATPAAENPEAPKPAAAKPVAPKPALRIPGPKMARVTPPPSKARAAKAAAAKKAPPPPPPAPVPAGYSGTPLAQKLGIQSGMEIFAVGQPRAYSQIVAPLPEAARVVSHMSATTDIVHIFSTERERLARALHAARARIKPDGAIWASWPKKASQVATDLTEDAVRAMALRLGLVDVKVCAVDDTWSGLKLVIRKALRPK